MDVISFQIKENYTIEIDYENGEKRIFDMKPFLKIKPWDKIKSEKLFNMVFLQYGTLAWPGEIDIAPETLYIESVPAEIFVS